MGVVHHSTRFLRAARRPPTLYTREGDRHATWLELFFDLVYVVAVAELGGLLHEDHSLTGFLGFAGLFVIVWWTWLGFSTYADQFDTDDIVHRVGMVAVMFGVIVLTGTIPSALHGGSFAFALAYLLLRTLYIGMYFRVWLNVPEYRQFSAFVIGSTTLSASVWAVSLFFPEPTRFAIWGLSFVVSIVVTVRGYVGLETIPRPTSHFSERLGLFTILVLGETVLAVAVGTSGTDWAVGSALTAIAGFLIAVSFWWTYFRHVDEWFVDRMYRTNSGAWSREREVSFAHVIGHIVVFIGIITTGVGIALAIEAAIESHTLEPSATAAVAGGVAIFLLGTSLVHRTTPEPPHDHVLAVRLTATALLVLMAFLAPEIVPLTLVGLVAVLLVGLNAFEGFRAYLQEQAVAMET